MYRLTPIGLLDSNYQPVADDDQDYLDWLAAGNAPQWEDGLSIDDHRREAIAYLQQWRGTKRAEAGLSEARFQELVYARKAERSRAWLVSGGSFPFAAEAAARGMTNTELAQLIVGEDEALLGYNDQIEAVYVAAREAIEAAKNVEQIKAALAGLG